MALTKEQQRAKTQAEMAVFAARKQPATQQSLGQQMSANLQKNAERLQAAVPVLTATVHITQGAQQTAMVLEGAAVTAEALRVALNDLSEQGRQHNLAGLGRFTSAMRIEIEVALK